MCVIILKKSEVDEFEKNKESVARDESMRGHKEGE